MNYDFKYIKASSLPSSRDMLGKVRFSERQIAIRRYEGGIVAPFSHYHGGVYSSNGYVEHTRIYGPRPKGIPTPTRYEDCDVLYLGTFISCWGHAITDNLTRLWPLLKQYRGLLPEEVKYVYTTSTPRESLPGNFFELLGLLGLKRGQLVCVEETTRFRNVYCAEQSMWEPDWKPGEKFPGGRQYVRQFAETVDAIVSAVVPKDIVPFRTIYFTRSNWHVWKPDVGEAVIAHAMNALPGCEIVSPERLSFSELLRLLSETKTLITTDGSCAHNAIFLPRGSNLVILRKADYWNDHQFMIASLRDLNVTYVDAHHTFLSAIPTEPWQGPFLLEITPQLAEYLGVKPSRRYGDYVVFFMSYCKMRIVISVARIKGRIGGMLRCIGLRK